MTSLMSVLEAAAGAVVEAVPDVPGDLTSPAEECEELPQADRPRIATPARGSTKERKRLELRHGPRDASDDILGDLLLPCDDVNDLAGTPSMGSVSMSNIYKDDRDYRVTRQ